MGTQLPLPHIKPECAGLFSEHYVTTRFPGTDKYQTLAPPNGVRKKLKTLMDKVRPTATQKNEAQLEDDLIRPVLNELGINYIVAVGVPGGQEADYAFFTDQESRAGADAREKEKWKGAVALADAKRCGRELDKGGGTVALDKNPNAVPTKQIANYIQDTGIDWGVLTDGRIWRLYNRNTPPVSQSFFEINLPEALEDDRSFHLFYALFSGAAFAAEAQEYVRRESENYWAAIGDNLKERARDALEILCNGFFKLNNRLDLSDTYEGAVIFLYRLLFILYAESRKLLPLDSRSYYPYSLQKVLKEVEGDVEDTLSDKLHKHYDVLKTLFHLIGDGDPSLGVYHYNGGLFKNDGLPFLPPNFLEDNAVPDRLLATALKKIAFIEDKKAGRHQVDFSELDVRHLGSIYEGLLEFHPRLENGEVKLFTDKGERKATGSYYTPGYIVDYIVGNTLGPLTEDARTPDDVLTLKILDPAMGSGHFLVGAVDFIGRKCVTLAGAEVELTEKEYQRFAVEKCIYGVDLNPLAVELAKLSLWLHTVAKDKPLSFLDHHLKLGNSLVGARVADLGALPAPNKKGNANAQQNLFALRLEQAMPAVLNEVMGILARGTEDITDVEAKEALFKAAAEHLEPFKAVADKWVGTYFDSGVTADEYDGALNALATPGELKRLAVVERARAMNAGRNFFHWELEFPEVFYDEHGREKDTAGFDGVIGNPPYVDVKADGLYATFATASCTNLYGYFIEKGLASLRPGGRFGMIVPLSLVCSSRMKPLRDYVEGNISETRVATFAKRPASVFPKVQQRTAIILSFKGDEGFRLLTTRYNRWYKGDELAMIARLKYVETTPFIKEFGWPKAGDKTGARVLNKILKKKYKLGSVLGGPKELYYHSIGMYWLNAFTYKPVFKDSKGNARESANLKTLYAKDAATRDLLVGIINSSLFNFYWNIYSDDFHLLVSEVERFPLEYDPVKYGNVYDMVSAKVKELMKDYKKHSFLRRATVQGKTVVWQEFKPALSKPILDEIDMLLSILYGLTDEETQYVVHYDEEFRVHGAND